MARDSPSLESPASPVRGTVRIPKEQAALLEKSDSWISSLKASNHALGLVNLPADVLTSFEQFHRKRLLKRRVPTETEDTRKQNVHGELRERGQSQENAAGKGSTSRCTTPEESATEPAALAEEKALAMNHGSDYSNRQLESSPGSPIPWTPSPNREPATSAERILSSDAAQIHPQPQPPSSSLEFEEELEVVTPRGVRDAAGTANLGTAQHLHPSPTPGYTSSRPPPCGQGDRHLTDADSDGEVGEDMQARVELMNRAGDVPGRRTRRMQGPVFPLVIPEKTSHLGNRHATAKIQPAPRLSMLDSSQPSSSSVDARTSPAGDNPVSSWETSGPGKRQHSYTPNADASSKRLRTLHSDTVRESSARQETSSSPSRKMQRSPPENLLTSPREIPEPHNQPMHQMPNPDLKQEPPPAGRRTSCRDTYHEGATRQDIFVPATPLERYPNLVTTSRIAQPARDTKPFEIYRAAYPEYHGTLTDFVNACISLEYIERQDSMRDLLYDDFIHAWVEGYVGYVAKYGDGALPANQWFNRLRGRVEFDKMIITRDTLRLVPEAYPEAYPKEYREDLRVPNLGHSSERPPTSRTLLQTRAGSTQEEIPHLQQTPHIPERHLDHSPERPASSRTFKQTVRPGSDQEVIPVSRQTTGSPKRHLGQNDPDTLPRTSRVTPELQMPRPGIPPSQHSGTIHDGNGRLSTSSQATLIIPATQSPLPTALNQRPQSRPIQGFYYRSDGKRPVYPQTPYSVVAESPLNRVVTPKAHARHSMPPRDNSGKEEPSFNPTTQTPGKTDMIPRHQDEDDRLGSPSAPRGTPDVGGSNGGLRGYDIASSGRPSSNAGFEGAKKHAGTPDRPSERGARSPDFHSSATSDSFFERSRIPSPVLHSSAYASPSPPERNDSNDDGPRNTNRVLAKVQHTEVRTGPKTKDKEGRGPRHSIATSNPTRVIDGRVHKDRGRKSSDSKGGREESVEKLDGGKKKKKKKKKKRRVTWEAYEDAFKQFILKRWDEKEKAATSPASGQSPAPGH